MNIQHPPTGYSNPVLQLMDNSSNINNSKKDFRTEENENSPYKTGSSTHTQYKVYKSRWLMLTAVVLLNVSNTLMMLTFAAAADIFIAFYEISTLQMNILSMTFMIVFIPVGFFASWVLEARGLRFALIISAWLNGIGGLIRNASHSGIIPREYSYIVLFIGQVIAACAQPFILFAPTKIAALWFPRDRRTTANMIGALSKNFGLMVAFLFVPFIVKDQEDIPLVMYSISGPAWLVAIVTSVAVKRSEPPSPPSPSAEYRKERSKSGFKQLFTNKDYLLLNLSFGTGQAMYVALMIYLLQILCPRGYSHDFIGLCGALMMGSGLIISPFVSIYVDKTKKFEEVYKIGYSITVLAGILFTQVSRLRDQQALIAVSISLFGGFCLSLLPVAMELVVEVTYPVDAATSSGLCIIGGQLQCIAVMFAMQYVAEPLPHYEQRLESGCYLPDDSSSVSIDLLDWTNANLYINNLILTVVMATMVLLVKTKYRRLEMEQKILAQAEREINETKHHIPEIYVVYSTRL